MKPSKILTTTSLAVLLGSFGAIACGGAEVEPAGQIQSAGLAQPTPQTPAPEARRPEHAEHHRAGREGKGRHGPPSPEKMLERFDDNKNGSLEAAELPERMQEHLGDIDTNKDAVVSKDELAAHMKNKFMARAKERFDRKDANHDGVLEQSELGERWAKLSVADQNGDAKLTPDELRAAFESGKLQLPMRGEHRKHGKRHEGDAPAVPTPPVAPAP